MSISKFALQSDAEIYKQPLQEEGVPDEVARRLMLPDGSEIRDVFDVVVSKVIEMTEGDGSSKTLRTFLGNVTAKDFEYLSGKELEAASIRKRLSYMTFSSSRLDIAQERTYYNRDKKKQDVDKMDEPASVFIHDKQSALALLLSDNHAFSECLSALKADNLVRIRNTFEAVRRQMLSESPDATFSEYFARLLAMCEDVAFENLGVNDAIRARLSDFEPLLNNMEEDILEDDGTPSKLCSACYRVQDAFLLSPDDASIEYVDSHCCFISYMNCDMICVQVVDNPSDIDADEVKGRWKQLWKKFHNPAPRPESGDWQGTETWNASYVLVCEDMGTRDEVLEALGTIRNDKDVKKLAKGGTCWGVGMFVGVLHDGQLDLYIADKTGSLPLLSKPLSQLVAWFDAQHTLEAFPSYWQLNQLPKVESAEKWREKVLHRLVLEAKTCSLPGSWKTRQKTFLNPALFEQAVVSPLFEVIEKPGNKAIEKVLEAWSDGSYDTGCDTPEEMIETLSRTRRPQRASDAESIVEEIDEATKFVFDHLAQTRCLHLLPEEKKESMGLDNRMFDVISRRLGVLADAVDDAMASVASAKESSTGDAEELGE